MRLENIANQYTQPMNFNFDLLAQSRANIERVQSLYDRLREVAGDGDAGRVAAIADEHRRRFDDALDDNLNTPRALAEVLAFVGEVNKLEPTPGEASAALAAIDDFDAILVAIDREARAGLLASERAEALLAEQHDPEPLLAKSELAGSDVEILLALRAEARSQKDWTRADAIRDKLRDVGVVTEDTPRGVRWKLG